MIASSSETLRICLISAALAPYHREGGIGQYVRVLAEGLGARGHHVTVVGTGLHRYDVDVPTEESFKEAYGRSISLPALRIRGRWFGPRLYALRAALSAARYVEANRGAFDLVESSNWLGFGAFVDRAHVPSVVRVSTPAIEGWGPSPNLQLVNWLEGRACRHASLVIAHSRAILEKTARLYRSARTPSTIVPLAVQDVADTGFRPAADRVDVLYLGRAEARKGTDILLRALHSALAAATQLHVTFIGADFGRYLDENPILRDLWAELHARYPERIVDAGVVPEQAKFAAIARAHWLVAPSRFESFGLIVPEAMRAGTPVLVSSGGALPDVAMLGPHNRVFGEPEDVRALAAALIDLENLGAPSALAFRGPTRQAYLAHFAPPAFIDATLEHYERVLRLPRAQYAANCL